MKTARRIAPALLNRLTIPCFARCCLCSHYSGNWPRRKKRRSDPNGACAQQPLILPPLLLMMVAAGGAAPLFLSAAWGGGFPDLGQGKPISPRSADPLVLGCFFCPRALL